MALYRRANNNVDLQAALEQCSEVLLNDFAIALLYTPAWCGFAQIGPTANDWRIPPQVDRRLDRDSIFEARIFSERAELRWLKDWPNKGRAALISELDISGYLGAGADTMQGDNFIDQTYLLWGEGIEATNELPERWSRLAMARVGTLDVPYPLDDRPIVSERNQRIHLVAREYLNVIDEHGNVAVVEERLVKLERT
jgi:CRISPR-associated protein (TIGR03984 family)